MKELAAALLAVVASAASLAAPLALVADVVGNASLQGNRLRLLQELDADSVIAVNGGGEVVVFYLADGTQWSLKGTGGFRFTPSGPESAAGAPPPERRATQAAFRDLRVRSDRVTQGGVVMRSIGGEALALTSPVSEVVVTTPVELSWTPMSPAATYAVEVVDDAGARVFARELAGTTVALPASVKLVPGRTYRWTVRGKDAASGRATERAAEFRYADDATRQRLARARPAADAPFAQRVMYVALLDSEGARSAARELQRSLAGERKVEWAGTP